MCGAGHRHEPPPNRFSGASAKTLDPIFGFCSSLFLLVDLLGFRGAAVSGPKNDFRERLRPRSRHRSEQCRCCRARRSTLRPHVSHNTGASRRTACAGYFLPVIGLSCNRCILKSLSARYRLQRAGHFISRLGKLIKLVSGGCVFGFGFSATRWKRRNPAAHFIRFNKRAPP